MKYEINTTTAFTKIARLKDRIRIIQGASRSSKTYSILQYLILLSANKEAKLTVSICAQSLPHLRRGAMKDFFDILKSANLYDEKNHNKTVHTYQLNGVFYEFFGVDEADKLRGAARDIVFVNEANNVSHDVFTQLFIRTNLFCFLDFNPSHLGWIRDYINPDKSNFVKLTYLDNEFISPNTVKYFQDAIKKAENGNKKWINFVKVFVYGEEGVLDGAIYENWEVVEEPENIKYMGAGMDYGWNPDPTTIIAVYQTDKPNTLYLKEKFYKNKTGNSALADFILKDDELTNSMIISDVNPLIVSELRSYNIPIKAAKKGAGSIVAGISVVQDYTLLIDSKSEHLINELKLYQWEKNNDEESMGVPLDKNNHCCDAFRYFISDRLSKSSNNYCSLKWVS